MTDPLIGQVIADRYQILELLGEGGMGRVYLAEHVRMGRKSAVKVMSQNLALSADAISRFNREAANASRINHPNVAQIYDFGETSDGVLYLAMELVDGRSLRDLIAAEGALEPARAAQITKQVADALAAAHHLGIVHRDLKPDNVMIARHMDGSDWVKVVDFGIAKTVQGSGEGGSQTVTTAGVSLGTPEYMSPEQLAGERLDHRTDIYSLGLVAFNMLTADLPYPRVTSKETLVRRLTSRPLRLADVRPDIAWSESLQGALDKALEPELTDRYTSALDFGRDVLAASAEVPQAPASAADTARTVRIETTRPLEVPAPAAAMSMPVQTSRSRAVPMAIGALLLVGAGAGAAIVWSKRQAAKPSADVAVFADSITRAAIDSAKIGVIKIDTSKLLVAPNVALRDTVRAAPPPAAPAPPATAPPATATATATARPAPATAATLGAAAPAHPWMRPNGDSVATPALPADARPADRVRALAEEIQGHLQRANQFLLDGNLQRARGEFRDVQQEFIGLKTVYPDLPLTRMVEQRVRMSAIKAVAACRAIVADSTKRFPPNFRCEQLFAGGRGARNLSPGPRGLPRRPERPQ